MYWSFLTTMIMYVWQFIWGSIIFLLKSEVIFKKCLCSWDNFHDLTISLNIPIVGIGLLLSRLFEKLLFPMNFCVHCTLELPKKNICMLNVRYHQSACVADVPIMFKHLNKFL